MTSIRLRRKRWIENDRVASQTEMLCRGLCSCDTDAAIISSVDAARNATVLEIGHGRSDFNTRGQGLLRIDKRSLGDAEIDPPSMSCLLQTMCLLATHQHEVIDCGCGKDSLLVYLSTALRCPGIGFEAVHGRAQFAERIVEQMSRHVLGVDVSVYHRSFLDESVDISRATVVIIYDQMFEPKLSHRLVDR